MSPFASLFAIWFPSLLGPIAFFQFQVHSPSDFRELNTQNDANTGLIQYERFFTWFIEHALEQICLSL